MNDDTNWSQPVPIPFWKRPGFWEWVEIVAAIAALLSAILAVVDKLSGAIWGSFFGALILACKFIQKRLEKKERMEREQLFQRLLQTVLRAMHLEYFTRVEDAELHQHRVTLLVCRESGQGKGQKKFLEIFARAGRYADSTTILRLDDNEPARCEGLAGQVWFCNASQFKELPPWPADDGVAARLEYANSGFLGIEVAMALNVKSRVLSGVPVRVFGRRWGVLILDSQTPGFITNQPQKVEVVEWYAELLARMIEGGTER